MLIAKINWEWSMRNRPYEPTVEQVLAGFDAGGKKLDVVIEPGGRVSLTNIHSDDDQRRAREILSDVASIGWISPESLLPTPPPPKPPRKSAPFWATAQLYLRDQAWDNSNTPKTVRDKQATLTRLADQISEHFDLQLFGKTEAIIFKERLMDGDKKVKAGAARINKQLGHLSHFMQWAVKNHHAVSNPFEGLTLSTRAKLAQKVQSYEPFPTGELNLIFSQTTYDDYAIKPHFKWLPFLLLYSGARPNELAGVSMPDVRDEDGIPYFYVRSGKNSNSQRKIPFHKVIRESGFMDYVAQRRQADPTGQLFPELSDGPNGFAKNLTRRFNEQYLAKTLGITDDTHRLYSLRKNFISRMGELNVHPVMLMALVGHYDQAAIDLSSPHVKAYHAKAKKLQLLRETMDLFDLTLPMKF
jgi:integrase